MLSRSLYVGMTIDSPSEKSGHAIPQPPLPISNYNYLGSN